MGQPAKPLDQEHDPVLEAMRRAPFVPLTEEERVLLEEAKTHPGPMIPHEEFTAMVAALRPSDATDDLDDE